MVLLGALSGPVEDSASKPKVGNVGLAKKREQGARLGRRRSVPADTEARARSLREEGLSVRKVAERLAGEGLGPPGGGAWQPSTLQRILTRSASGD